MLTTDVRCDPVAHLETIHLLSHPNDFANGLVPWDELNVGKPYRTHLAARRTGN
jgi:hypothetical protein